MMAGMSEVFTEARVFVETAFAKIFDAVHTEKLEHIFFAKYFSEEETFYICGKPIEEWLTSSTIVRILECTR